VQPALWAVEAVSCKSELGFFFPCRYIFSVIIASNAKETSNSAKMIEKNSGVRFCVFQEKYCITDSPKFMNLSCNSIMNQL
jgi:hypothetical protein